VPSDQPTRWVVPTIHTLWLVLCLAASTLAADGDWPTWRHDAGRTGASELELPSTLSLQWVRVLPPLEPAWKNPINRERMRYDRAYEPVVWEKMLFLASSRNDTVTVYDTETGAIRWTFYADGPVRLAPTAWRGKLYVVSDDGCLYCLDARTGREVWRHRGGPSERLVLGNERLISMWPARGGAVIVDGTVYYTVGIWPLMGIFIYGLDAETGAVVWENSGSGSLFIKQPHNSPSFAGVAPQGHLVAVGGRLLLPGGRSTPACFDRLTGDYLYYNLAAEGKRGGSSVAAAGGHYYNGGQMYELGSGRRILGMCEEPVLTPRTIFSRDHRGGIAALDLANLRSVEETRTYTDRSTGEEKTTTQVRWVLDTLWTLQERDVEVLIKAGSRLYAGKPGEILAIDLRTEGDAPAVAWRKSVTGTPVALAAAAGKLFATTLEGHVYCFGPSTGEPRSWAGVAAATVPVDARAEEAAAILQAAGVTEGYSLVLGDGDGRLAEELARQSDLQVIGLEPDPARAERARRRLDAAGVYGRPVAVVHADPARVPLPKYLASLIVCADRHAAGFASAGAVARAMFESLRPYGGTLCIPGTPDDASAVRNETERGAFPGADVSFRDGLVLLRREGPLPGAGSWTHQYGDAANTVVSKDDLVKLPLGILWFGGTSHEDVLPRHGHGPPEQIMGGRLFIEGIDCLAARDVYTGRELWKRDLPGLTPLGVYYDETYNPDPLDKSYNQVHIAGANARGTNFLVAPDRVYVIYGTNCLALDPASGQTLSRFTLPRAEGETGLPDWGYLGVWEDLLLAGAGFVRYSDVYTPEQASWRTNFDFTSSRRLVAMDRLSGEVRWTFTSQQGLRHAAIAVGSGKVFCIDAPPAPVAQALRDREEQPATPSRLLALDARTGDVLWSTTEDVFGTWLGYSEPHDVLIQAGRASSDMLAGEPNKQMTAYRGADGLLLWSKDSQQTYSGPPLLHDRSIIVQGLAFDLLTGGLLRRANPITGEEALWTYFRNYGCNYPIASTHLITFRSAAAGYFDLEHDAGTGNFGGFKSGCTSNLIAADGVLNAPDYTRTCTCSYQNQCSLALVHMPEVELWQETPIRSVTERVRRVGINLGAPGDRKDDSGTLWVEYPDSGGRSPEVAVEASGQIRWYCRHSSRVVGDGPHWVAASGGEGIESLALRLAGEDQTDGPDPALYRVRLHFAEPDDLAPGERIFDVAIQGTTVIEGLDVVAQAGAPRTVHVVELPSLSLADMLTIDLVPRDGSRPPILSGVEVLAEDVPGD